MRMHISILQCVPRNQFPLHYVLKPHKNICLTANLCQAFLCPIKCVEFRPAKPPVLGLREQHRAAARQKAGGPVPDGTQE